MTEKPNFNDLFYKAVKIRKRIDGYPEHLEELESRILIIKEQQNKDQKEYEEIMNILRNMIKEKNFKGLVPDS